MKNVTFELVSGRVYRHSMRIFLRGNDGNYGTRTVVFSKAHSVKPEMRNEAATAAGHKAQLIVSDEALLEAMYRDSAYGKTFIEKGDEKGEKKQASYNITEKDAEKIVLQRQFEIHGIDFDGRKDVSILKAELQLFLEGLTGRKVEGSAPMPPIVNNVDVAGDIANAAEQARELYKEKYGEEVPEEFTNDMTFLSGLADPNWDAKGYIERKSQPDELTLDELQAKYKELYGTNPANAYKTNAEWLKTKIAEKQ